ncbi:penicillin-binding transpeptidase domain-containing protein [Clostridium manihotivorum]|uniref:Penicillin-binding protein n=1 Tax=Clostridium manihotivorum TaxID=2320868 RepID=A0A3R5WZS1_9CLOT|nr:penicillin-binding transpeptidase domain-containing protein [Clostridium manihotivorum]QAA30677.1 penicillin-binding protein [Clostridium manihotivorum]
MEEKKEKRKFLNRFNALLIIMLFVFICIISRLIYLQVFKYDDYTEKANTRSRRVISEKAARGKIFDSAGNILATNKTIYKLTFTTTDESSAKFYDTMRKVFKILDDRGDEQQDSFKLKIDKDGKPYFDFTGDSDDTRKNQEISFKRSRNLNDVVKKTIPALKDKSDLTFDEENQINEKLLKISAEDTFNYLLKYYNMYDILNPTDKEKKNYKNSYTPKEIATTLLKKYSIQELRRYMLVKDAIKMQGSSNFKPITIAYNLKQDTPYIFYQKLNDLPGIDISVEPMRTYPYGKDTLASGVIGYVSSIDSSKKDKYEERGYDVSTDLIGKSGIESAFESVLKGNTGHTIVNVNSEGRKTEELFKQDSSPGENIYLTLNKDIQYAVDKTLQDRLNFVATQYVDHEDGNKSNFNATRGAAIVMQAKTGRVLALSSYPGYDANIISDPSLLTPEVSKQYFSPDYDKIGQDFINKHHLNKTVDDLFPKDKSGVRQDPYDLIPKPFYNYATTGLIHPGSTFKPLTALAGLQEGVIDSRTTVNDAAPFTDKLLGSQQFHDDGYHGSAVDIKKAIAVSCNYFFYQTGLKLYEKNGMNTSALDSLAKYAWQLGMGSDPKSKTKGSTGIEIGESFGQTYNYQYAKDQTLLYAKFELVNALEAGKYGDSTTFVPLDIASKDDDSDDLKATKQKIKDYILNFIKNTNSSNIVGLNDFDKGLDPLLNQLQKDSKVFEDRVKKYTDSGKKYSNYNVKKAIEQFIYDKTAIINTPAQLVLASIGQGMNDFSIVQLANYIATIVNGGTRYKVHLVDKITDSTGKVVQEFKPEVLNKIDISPTNLNLIKQGMQQANTDDLGTASSVFRDFPIPTGGKTGTATYNEQTQESIGRSAYGVYVSCAPIDDPEIVVAVVMYDGAHGFLAADVAKAAYEVYFKDRLQKEFPNYQPTFPYTFTSGLPDYKDDTKPR